jgi:hypothetical protein
VNPTANIVKQARIYVETTMRLGIRIAVVAVAVLVGGSFLSPASVQAHHSIANFWDANKDITITGMVKEVKLVNPHSQLTLEVMEDGQPVKWLAFGLGITNLRSRGITNEMLMGKELTLHGNPPKASGGKGIFMQQIVFADGKTINIRENRDPRD